MPHSGDGDVDCLLLHELGVEGVDVVLVEALDRTDYVHVAVFLVVYVLYGEAEVGFNEVVGTNAAVDLNHVPIPLGKVHTTVLQNAWMFLFALPFESDRHGRLADQVEVIRLRLPLRDQNQHKLPNRQRAVQFNRLSVGVGAADPPVTIGLFLNQNQPHPGILVGHQCPETSLFLLDYGKLAFARFISGELSETEGLSLELFVLEVLLLDHALACEKEAMEFDEVNTGEALGKF